MENYTFGNVTENSLDQQNVIYWLFSRFYCFLGLRFSYLGRKRDLKTLSFMFKMQCSLDQLSLEITECVLFVQLSGSGGQVCFSSGFLLVTKIYPTQEDPHFFSLESKPDLKLSELPGDQSNSLNTSDDSCVREAGDSGAARSPEPAPMPCGSCSKAAALDSIADTKTDGGEMKDSQISSQQREEKQNDQQ